MLPELVDNQLSNEDVIAGLKQALTIGSDSTVVQLNKLDGYYKNELIKVLLPEDVRKIQTVVEALPGGKGLLADLVVKMNRAAEDAATEAKPIFWDAITGITIADGFSILRGDSVAATRYLSDRTYSPLNQLYKPKIQNSLQKVGAQQVFTEITTLYNNLPTTFRPIETDLAQHVTDKALDGLFLTLGQKERDIRRDPLKRVTDLLRRVFAQQD
jgi:hypothetical protein